MFTRIPARIVAFFRPGDLDRDLDEELESHLGMLAEDNIRRGMTPERARRAALIQVGGVASIKEQHRRVRGLPSVEAVLQDLRFAFRLLGKDRWFSAAAVAALALGIGVNAIGFTVVRAAFLRGLPFEDSGRVYVLSWQNSFGDRSDVTYAELQDWRARSRSFASFAAYNNVTMNISDERALPEQVRGTRLTANAFSVLRQLPLLGRDFTAGDERPGAEPVVIIEYSVWKNRYGTDPNVLGKTLRVDGQPATIVGVMPDNMRFPEATMVWAPYRPTTTEGREARDLTVFGRLAAGVARDAAQSELHGLGQQLAAADRDAYKDLVGVQVETFGEQVGGIGRTLFLMIMGAASFVLLIACANVANMLLSRSAYRAREMAVRMALGATRGRVVRQLLLESVVLGVLGGSIGLILAVAVVGMFDAAVPFDRPYWMVFTVDRVVLGYAAAICVLTAVVFGLAPALQVSKANNHDALKEGGRGSTGTRRLRVFSSTLVVAELTLTIALLAGAGLLVRSFIKLYSLDIGVSIDHLMTMRLELPAARYATPEARRAFFARLEPQLASITGVESSAVTTGVPPFDGGERLLEIDGAAGTSPRFVSTVTISPRFFEVVDRPLMRGRAFGETDGAPGSETAIINERLAAQFFPGEDPIGRRLRFTQRRPAPGEQPDVWRTIVGVSAPIRHGSPQDAYLNAVVYIPYRQDVPQEVSLLVRSALPPASVMDAVRREVQAIDRDQPVLTIQTLEQMLAADRSMHRIFGTVFAILAVLALLLSSLGLYAVMAYSVTQRTQEIGIRMALGAQGPAVSWLILKRGLLQLAVGLPFGLAGALALGVGLQRMLVDMTPADPLTFAAVTMLLTLVSIAACQLPLRRALRVDPLAALRAE